MSDRDVAGIYYVQIMYAVKKTDIDKLIVENELYNMGMKWEV